MEEEDGDNGSSDKYIDRVPVTERPQTEDEKDEPFNKSHYSSSYRRSLVVVVEKTKEKGLCENVKSSGHKTDVRFF